jgi:NADH:ubiquinone oxidoreductase subunit C
MMEIPAWYNSLKAQYAHAIVGERESAPGELEIVVRKEHAKEFLAHIQRLPQGAFEHLADLTAYDNSPRTPRFHMVYELISMTLRQRCSVLVPLDEVIEPRVDSVCSLWKGANWLEREVYDMYGIHFVGHPDLRRILLPEAFVGWPLRKDFVGDYRQEFALESDGEEMFDPFGNTLVQNVEE